MGLTTMKITLKNFRCFTDTGPIDLKPITILLGENSTGKSSFMAATRYAYDLLGGAEPPSFNKTPFDLGAFDEIANYRGGSAGRAHDFSIFLEEQIPAPLRPKTRGGKRARRRDKLVDASLNVSFVGKAGQTAISQAVFRADDQSLDIKFDKKVSFTLRNAEGSTKLPDLNLHRESSVEFFDLSFVSFLLRRRYLETGDDSKEQKESDAISRLLSSYTRFFRSVSRSVFAGAPVRSKVSRTYHLDDKGVSPDGNHIPQLLVRLQSTDPDEWATIRDALIEFGNASGLYSDFDIKRFGSSGSAPFQLRVKISGPKSNIADVGYGVSQIVPLISEIAKGARRQTFLIQQPEVHLHPKAQAALGSFVVNAAKSDNQRFIIETHSDYIVDRMRIDIRDGNTIPHENLSILFFERIRNDVKIHQLKVDEQGNLIGAPPSYRQFFLNEERRLLNF